MKIRACPLAHSSFLWMDENHELVHLTIFSEPKTFVGKLENGDEVLVKYVQLPYNPFSNPDDFHSLDGNFQPNYILTGTNLRTLEDVDLHHVFIEFDGIPVKANRPPLVLREDDNFSIEKAEVFLALERLEESATEFPLTEEAFKNLIAGVKKVI